MAKRGPAFYLATEFLRAFPAQAKYGRTAAETHLKKLLEEADAPTLLRRLLLWSHVRHDLRPWELVKDPPQPPIVQATAPRRLLDPKTLPPVDPKVLGRVRTILAPYDEEDI